MRPRPDIEVVFGGELSAPRRVRRAVAPTLAGVDDPIAEDVQLAVSELVTNVVIHTGAGGTLRLWDPRPDVPVRVEVDDHSIEIPRIPAVAPDVGGRGLRMVAAISDDWGVITSPNGKTVWAEFDRDARHERSRQLTAPV